MSIHNHLALIQSLWTLLAGAIVSGLITIGLYWIKTKSDHMDRTILLHKDFSSLEFIGTRNRAYVLLATYPDRTFMDLAKDLADPNIRDNFIYLLRLLTFYEHLSIGVISGYLDRKAAQAYFGEVFV